MPELPEVESIRRVISKQVCNTEIKDVVVFNNRTLEHITTDNFIDSVKGSTINRIDRRGKYLIFRLSAGKMVIHLRMHGMLYVTENSNYANGYDVVSFVLSDNKILHLEDFRKFAKVYFIPSGVEDKTSGVHRLGLEPFDIRLTADYLKSRWKYSTKSIKETLLDQDVVAGIGNFYSDDILFLCGIYPKKRCINLSDKNYEDLAKTIPDVMQWGIDYNIATQDSKSKVHGRGFSAKDHSYVYGRAGKMCRICRTPINSYKFGSRTCCFCPSCQRRVKIIPNEVSPALLCEVAQYIGSYIQLNKKDYWTPYKTSDFTWEEFVLREYSNIMTEDCIRIGDQCEGKFRQDRILVFNNMSDSSFQVGIDWIKSQKWKE